MKGPQETMTRYPNNDGERALEGAAEYEKLLIVCVCGVCEA